MRVHRCLLAPTVVAVAVTAFGLAAPGVASAHPGGHDLLRSGLVGSTPTGPVLFGVRPGGAPWVTDDSSSVRVREDGRLDVKIRDLVIPPPAGTNNNPVPAVSASVVCNGAIADTTALFPMGTAGDDVGDARIRQTLDLPDPCLAPAVLVHPNGNLTVYIAANG